DQGGEDEAQIASNGEELQMIQHLRCPTYRTGDRRIQRVPDRIGDVLLDACRRSRTWRRHGDGLVRAEYHRAVNSTDRLCKAASGVLSLRARVGKAAIPG